MERRQSRLLFLPTLQPLWLPLALISGAIMLFLVALYQQPFVLRQDIGAQPVTIDGLYEPEHNTELSYAYTNGAATVRLPQAGGGHYLLGLRMAGPGAIQPIAARMSAAQQTIDLGRIQQLRTYHLLLPVDQRGDLHFTIHSTTTPVADGRTLGALLDWLAVRSIGPLQPPLLLLLSTPPLLVLLAGATVQLATRYRWRIVLCVLTGGALSVTYALSRGALALPLGMIVLCTWAAVTLIMALSQFERLSSIAPLRSITALFVAWRAALGLIGALAVWYSQQLYPFADLLSDGAEPHRRPGLRTLIIGGWLQWDTEHYLTIAQQGYSFFGQRWPNIAFFPLYPLLIRLTALVVGNDFEIAALLVTHAAGLAALLLLYDLLAHDVGHAPAARTIMLILIFPAAIFLVAGYSEALALLLVVAAVWAMRRERWWLAGGAGALLALTRLPGVLLAPVLAIVYMQQHHWRWRSLRPNALAVLLPPAGLALFMLFQWQRFGTATAFLQAQQRWENRLSMPWTMPVALFEELTGSLDWPIVVPHAAVWLGFIALAVLALRRLPLVYGLTALLLLLPPYLSSYPRSMARYVLIAFPAFVALACWAELAWRRRLLIGVMLPLLVVAVILFVNGFWVA